MDNFMEDASWRFGQLTKEDESYTPAVKAQLACLLAIAQQLARIVEALEEITRQPDLENERQELLGRNGME